MNAHCLAAAVLGVAVSASPQAKTITTPTAQFGHQVGADGFLATYTELVAYWRQLATETDRLTLEQIGTTSYGQPMLLAVVSAPANQAQREHYRGIAQRLCLARDLDATTAQTLARDGRAVVWIDAGMHATECVAAQNILELVYRLCAQDDATTRRILDQVIVLVCPANPDGMEMIARGYRAIGRVGQLPVPYQRWMGHDNNRDFYMGNAPETAAINRVLYHRWFPQIVYNHHQSAPRGTVIFTPPFRDPFNYRIDPRVMRGIELVAAHMNWAFAAEGKAGVISRGGAPYSTWWNGGLRTTAYFHNMIGILTEVFGSPDPTDLQPVPGLRLPTGDHPMPAPAQRWHARQTIEYLQTANYAVLDLAARYREELLLGIWQMGRDAIAAGSRDSWTPNPQLLAEADATPPEGEAPADGDRENATEPEPEPGRDPAQRNPRAYVLPEDQADPTALRRLVQALQGCGVEVSAAQSEFVANGVSYPAGTVVVPTAQAFRAHILDLFEPQWHPTDLGPKGEPIKPYDVAGWTLALQMGVRFTRLLEPLTVPLQPMPLLPIAAATPAAVPPTSHWVLPPGDSHTLTALARLLGRGEVVSSLTSAWQGHAAGTLLVTATPTAQAECRDLSRELRLTFAGADATRAPLRPVRLARVGLFMPYGGDLTTGWTQYVLEQLGLPFTRLSGRRVREGQLARDFDALVFRTGLPGAGGADRIARALRRGTPSRPSAEQLAELIAALPAFEDWTSADDHLVTLDLDRDLPALREFVESGGTLLALGNEARTAVKLFDLEVEVGTFRTAEDGQKRPTTRAEVFVPGSLVRLDVDTRQPLARGMARAPVVMFDQDPVFEARPGATGIDVIARYAEHDVLASGWAIGAQALAGKAAVLTVKYGAGRIGLYGPDVLHRGQSYGTFKLLLNAWVQ